MRRRRDRSSAGTERGGRRLGSNSKARCSTSGICRLCTELGWRASITCACMPRPSARAKTLLGRSQRGQVRALPRGIDLDEVFLRRAKRTVRKDNTIFFDGRRLEVTAVGMAGRKVELRFDPQDAESSPKVYVDGSFCCDTRRLDLHADSHRRRKRIVCPSPSHAVNRGTRRGR